MDKDVGIAFGTIIDLGISLFLDRGDDDGEAMGASGVEEEEREASVAGDETESVGLNGCARHLVEFRASAAMTYRKRAGLA